MAGTSPAMTEWTERDFPPHALRLIFMGTPDFAVPTLLELVAHGHEIVAVYTRAPKPAGRGMKLQPTPVEQEARRLGIPVLTPTHAEDAGSARGVSRAQCRCGCRRRLRHDPAAGHLDAPPLGCFNLHASLLPRWRGAADQPRHHGRRCRERRDGDEDGCRPRHRRRRDGERLAITDTMTAADLHDALAPLGADLMVRAMDALARGGLRLRNRARTA